MPTAAEKALDKLRREDPEAARASLGEAENAATAEASEDFGANGVDQESGSLILREFGTPEEAIGHFVSSVGFAELPPNLTYEDYSSLMAGVGLYKAATVWMAGDLLVYGAARWEDRYAQAADLSGYDEGMLEIAQGLARDFPYETRHPKLPWTCHQVVKSLPPEERESWLQQAEEKNWTRDDLREALRVAQGRPKAGPGRPRKEGYERAAGARVRKPKAPDEAAITRLIEKELEPRLADTIKLGRAFLTEAENVTDELSLSGATSKASAIKLAKTVGKLRDQCSYLVKDLTALERHAITVAEYEPPREKKTKAAKPKTARKKK